MSGYSDVLLQQCVLDDLPILVVRDDLYPQNGGGIKSRKAAYYATQMSDGGFNACVTTGGIQSNHNRAIALMCAQNGWQCHLVYHGQRDRFNSENGNALIVRKSGASVEFVNVDQISTAMDAAMHRFADNGFNPLYIHGGGHDLPGGIAFVEAIKSLKEKCDRVGYKPDYIFLASGTGSTQAGIVVGLDLVGWHDVKVIGISVARQKSRGTQVVEDFTKMLAKYYDIPQIYEGKIIFNTDYLFGGYENCSDEMKKFLDEAMLKTGLLFDTTYSGKAFFGMNDYIRKNKLQGNFVFWHTGGLMNLMK